MPKRKVDDSGDEFENSPDKQSESESASASSEEEAPIKAKAKKGAKDAPATKKAKTTPVDTEASTSKGTKTDDKVKVNAEGDKYIDLGKKKRAVVRSFKGMALIDIREYYGADGEEKPGKKGISLTAEQWKSLRESSDDIDNLLAELQKKSKK